ncbi:hypothetical protein C7974DRAFT_39111 [Boeremia exigua]|uniref:uncharacterized protein n=1 Tax=Boeremia exigua TaxID=749465 RepID=UPI001E8EBC97|nr:uncharacterized protein C7974DRAFT_39111 [Boeremia exigua]KAH6618896.1 hypothetical protein C7974DRAFT_39111 [Boeremia exigua]
MLAILTMAPLSIIGALSVLPLALAHMQMSSPSPLRDPHATDRPDEPKDYNILSPLNADGSNFACKGYHLNTPLTTVATYPAGSKQTLRLRGDTTHSGGSCQISLSCNGGDDFYVIESIMGGCPLRKNYDFTIPSEIPAAKKCLLAWTWFNKIGNREMYMNCAVIDITNKRRSKRDSQAAASNALSKYPELFVANLANINNCKIQETTEVVFDNPGKSVIYANGKSASSQPSFRRGQCTGKPSKNAGSKDAPSSNYGGGGGGQWTAPAQSSSKPNDCAAKNRSGKYYPECFGGNARMHQQEQQPAQQQPQQPQQPQEPKQAAPKRPSATGPNPKVQQDLDAYLATLYGRGGLARRATAPASDYVQTHSQKQGYSASSHTHRHGEDCKHKNSGYPQDSHYDTENVNSYPKGGDDYSNKHVYDSQESHYYEDSDLVSKRVARQKRWTSYDKRDDGPRAPTRYYRPNPSAYQASAEAPKEVSAETSDQPSTEVIEQAYTEESTQAETQAETQTPNEAVVQKIWTDMTEAEKFEAFLRRIVELSSNMASLVKYAAASTVNIPWYPPASTYDRTPASTNGTTQDTTAVHRLAIRGVISSARSVAQIYPGPSVGSISDPGDATDAEDGFKLWFPHLVQGLVTKRQLVDPVTSEASADAGDSVNFFDVLAAGFWKLFGNFDDAPTTDFEPAPTIEDIPLVLGEPDLYSGQPDFPDFDIPDLDGHYTFGPQISAPEPPVPQLLPGYEEGPNGPIWVGEGPDPLADTEEPSIVDSTDGSNSTVFPGEDVPVLLTCTEPIPQIGFNSCLGGCNHTAEEIAAHETYLEEFAKQQAEFEECLATQAVDGISSSPSHGIWHGTDDSDESQSEAEDASGRRPRPVPMIPYPRPDNFTSPFPSNTTTETAPVPIVEEIVPEQDTPLPVDLLPYQNKTLGELVSEIMGNPELVASPDDEVQGEDEANSLQEAVDQAEEGVTVEQEPTLIDPSTLETIADALPFFLGPGPVLTNDVPAEELAEGGAV